MKHSKLSGQSRRSAGWSRYKSAPLQQQQQHQAQIIDQLQQQPLNDISNIFQLKNKLMLSSTTSNSTTTPTSDEQTISDLENLLYGNLENQQQMLIKQALEVDATCNGALIGDRSKKHILPTITSSKHQDLHCISPNTVSIIISLINLHFLIPICVTVSRRIRCQI